MVAHVAVVARRLLLQLQLGRVVLRVVPTWAQLLRMVLVELKKVFKREKRDILLATCGRHFADASGIKCHEKVKLFHAHVITAKCYITLKFLADPLKARVH